MLVRVVFIEMHFFMNGSNFSFPFLVVLQAIVYSLLLLFVHPRPEPRTMSLVETVCY